MLVKFTKMQGVGNDFVVVDEWNGEVIPEKSKPSFVSRISDRHFGVGCDGVIFVQKSVKQDARFQFFNPDGSLAEMCGNGIRCFARYLYEKNLVCKPVMSIETLAGARSLQLTVERNTVVRVTVDMGAPQLKRKEAQVSGKPGDMMVDEEVDLDGSRLRITAVGMGNPHAVLFVDNIEGADVVGLGGKVRNHIKLFPNGTNVHFIKNIGRNEFKIRTYERGVEGETLACGTGICASAVAAVLSKKANPKSQLTFHAKGGILAVELKMAGNQINSVKLTGPAETVFEGSYQHGPV